jgi:hypothetical protein
MGRDGISRWLLVVYICFQTSNTGSCFVKKQCERSVLEEIIMDKVEQQEENGCLLLLASRSRQRADGDGGGGRVGY